MQAKTHPYSGLSEQDYIVLLLDKDAALLSRDEVILCRNQTIEKLHDDRLTDRQTISEYRQLIW